VTWLCYGTSYKLSLLLLILLLLLLLLVSIYQTLLDHQLSLVLEIHLISNNHLCFTSYWFKAPPKRCLFSIPPPSQDCSYLFGLGRERLWVGILKGCYINFDWLIDIDVWRDETIQKYVILSDIHNYPQWVLTIAINRTYMTHTNMTHK